MAQPFVLGVNLRIQQVIGLDKVKQQLAGIQVGGVGQVDKLSTGLKSIGNTAGFAGLNLIKTTKATHNLGKVAKKTGGQVGRAGKKVQTFGDQTFLAGKRYAAFLSATVVAFKAFQAITIGTKSVIEFDQAMVSLSQIIDTSVDQLGDLKQQFLDLSVTTGTSAAEIANAAKLLAQAGFRGNELAEATEQLAKVPLTPIFENMDQAVDGAIAAMRQFSSEGLTVETVFDKMINVSNKYAASFPDIIEGLKRGGSAFQAIGGTLDEFIAAFTTIRSVTRESASAVGTSLKTVSTRLADPKIIKFLETKDIRLLERGQFVGPIEALKRIGEGLERTRSVQERVNIAVKLGGRRQVSRFLALSQNMEKTNEILGVSRNSFGEFDKVAQQGLQAIGKQIDMLIAKAKKLAIDLGESLFVPFIKGLSGAAEAAIVLLGALKPILPAIAKIGAAFAGAAIFKGVGGFLGPKLGKLAGPAAFAAAGGGLRGAGAGLAASPFIQAGLLVAAAEAASALTQTAEGAKSFTGTLITSIAGITAAIAIFRNQTIAQFAAGGGLFPSLGKKGVLGAIGGTAATIGAIALPILAFRATKSAKELSENIVDSAVKSVSEIKIDPIDPKSLTTGVTDFISKLISSQEELFKSAHIRSYGDPIIKKIFQGLGRTLTNISEGDYETLFRESGLTKQNVEDNFLKIIEGSKNFVNSVVDSIANGIAAAEKEISPAQRRFEPRRKLISAAIEAGTSKEEAIAFADLVIKATGGLDVFNERVEESAIKIQDEINQRKKIIQLTKSFTPNRLVSQLLRFSKAMDQTTKSITVSAKLFETQIAEIQGGIQAPSFEFDFGGKQVEKLIRTGGLKDLFSFTPDIPKFVSSFSEIEELLDNFIVNIGTSVDTDLPSEVDKFFENVPEEIRNNFKDFFSTIGQDIRNVSEGEFIDAEEIKKRFKDQFEKFGTGTSDVIVESITGFLNATFTRIQDELNRLSTIRRLELEVPVRPRTQAAFLEEQLRRVGVTAPPSTGRGQRGTIEELDLIRREREARGRRGGVPGMLPTPERGFFQGRGQRLADIAGNEGLRQQVRDSFEEIVIASAILRKELAELKPGTEGFINASERAKDLARTTIEYQTTLQALDQATQQALDTEKRTLELRQKLELEQARARLAERVRTAPVGQQELMSIQAERTLFDLGQEQAREQRELQDRFDTIIEKDNQLRVNLAKEISESTKTQGEITQEFGTSVNTFADATRLYGTTAELFKQNLAKFGQDFGRAIVDFKNLTIPSEAQEPRITPSAAAQQILNERDKAPVSDFSDPDVRASVLREITETFNRQKQEEKEQKRELPKTQREQETNEKTSQLIESIDGLRTILEEPNELKLVTDQRVDLDISTLPSDISEEVRPILEEAATVIARTVTRKALESLAAKSGSEISIAATDTAQELA